MNRAGRRLSWKVNIGYRKNLFAHRKIGEVILENFRDRDESFKKNRAVALKQKEEVLGNIEEFIKSLKIS